MADKMAAAKIVSAVVVTLILSYLSDFFQISCIKLLFMSEYGFCPMNDNQDCRQNGSGHYAGPLSESDCSGKYILKSKVYIHGLF